MLWFSFRWWCSETIAVVTGSNRGIGYEIATQLARHGLNVILTSRDINSGKAAANALKEGLNVSVHQLDIMDPVSVKVFAEWVHEIYGGIDILVRDMMLLLKSWNFPSTTFLSPDTIKIVLNLRLI